MQTLVNLLFYLKIKSAEVQSQGAVAASSPVHLHVNNRHSLLNGLSEIQYRHSCNIFSLIIKASSFPCFTAAYNSNKHKNNTGKSPRAAEFHLVFYPCNTLWQRI